MTKTEKAVARYIKTLDARERLMQAHAERYAVACDKAAAASVALGNLDPELRSATYAAWREKNP